MNEGTNNGEIEVDGLHPGKTEYPLNPHLNTTRTHCLALVHNSDNKIQEDRCNQSD